MNYHHEQRRTEKNDPDSSPVSFTELVRGLLADQFVNHRYRLIIGFIALISVDFLQLSIPLLVKKAIDALAAQDATMTKLFIIAGAILADVGKLLEYEMRDGKAVQSDRGKYLRHPFTGVHLAMTCGVPEEVCHIIATHAGEGELVRRSTEAWIVHHADFMSFLPFKNLA